MAIGNSGTLTNVPAYPATEAPRYFAILLLIACAACAALLVGWQPLGPLLTDVCDAVTGGSARCVSGINKIRIYAFTLALFPLILLLQRWRPAVHEQPAFAPGLVVDCIWFIGFPLLGVWLPTVVEEWLAARFGQSLEPWRLQALQTLPVVVQIGIVILASDFLAWLSHLIRHKVSLFWEFHKIHHSQRHLNAFTTVRLHPFDLIFNVLIRFLPFTLLGLSMAVPAFIGWIIFQRCYELLVHSNLRMNFGPLRYVLVTPQSHRIHHSRLREHVDRNFGDVFSIWDFLFGTQVRQYDIYPATGVHDPDVPEPRSAGLRDALLTYGQELLYPFRSIGRALARRRVRA